MSKCDSHYLIGEFLISVSSFNSHHIQHFVSYHAIYSPLNHYLPAFSTDSVPSSITKALLLIPHWTVAMDEEMKSLPKRGERKKREGVLTKLTERKKMVGCEWVFALNKDDRFIERYTARLVAKGFTQTHEFDFHQTFALVVKFNTNRYTKSCNE